MELPEDCWISIFNLLDHNSHFEFISLVSRRFLSIANRLRRSLTITDEVIPFLPNLLCRFPNLDEINISYPYFTGDLDGLLRQISASNIVLRSISLPKHKGVPIEGLRHLGYKMQSSLRILNCSRMFYSKDDVVFIAKTFPFLQELDLSYVLPRPVQREEYCLSDAEILHLSNLKELRKVDLSGILSLTDQSIISLSSNCLFLEELGISQCEFTRNRTGIALRDCHHLNSISVKLSSTYIECSRASLALYDQYSCIADEFLSDLAEANLPLEKLKITTRYATYKAISNLLHKYRSLVYLEVQRSYFLTDENVVEMSKFLKNITYINLSGCCKLTSAAFFTIIRSCPFLTKFEMKSANVKGIKEFETDFTVNRRVKDLGLAENYEMCDEFLKKMAITCPKLENLNLGFCYGITAEGINEVLRNCHEIKHLDISCCDSITEFNIDIQLPNLEVLRAKRTEFDDKSLEVIGERCNGLLDLDLLDAPNVSGNGVVKVVKKCKKLRRLNLEWCNNIDSDTIFSLLSLRSSLLKIKLSDEIRLSESEKKLVLPHTCQLDYIVDCSGLLDLYY